MIYGYICPPAEWTKLIESDLKYQIKKIKVIKSAQGLTSALLEAFVRVVFQKRDTLCSQSWAATFRCFLDTKQ